MYCSEGVYNYKEWIGSTSILFYVGDFAPEKSRLN